MHENVYVVKYIVVTIISVFVTPTCSSVQDIPTPLFSLEPSLTGSLAYRHWSCPFTLWVVHPLLYNHFFITALMLSMRGSVHFYCWVST